MTKLYCTFTILFCCAFPAVTFAQVNEEYYPDGTIKSRGKTIEITTKSSIAGKIKRPHKVGEWSYYDSTGTLARTENYAKFKDVTLADGPWQYYTTEGVLLKSMTFNRGNVTNEVWYDTGTYACGNQKIIIKRNDIGNLVAYEYLNDRLSFEKEQQFGQIVSKQKHQSSAAPKGSPKMFESMHIQNISLKPGQKIEGYFHNNNIRANPTFTITPAKNLVQNGGFEEHDEPYMTSVISVENGYILNWTRASGTPDYFNDTVSTHSRHGTGYAGIRVFSETSYIEYLQNQLAQPLEKDQNYCFLMHFKLSQYCNMASDAIGVKFSNNKFWFPNLTDNNFPQLQPNMVNPDSQFLYYRSNWMQLGGMYRARGGERFLTIGGFKPEEHINAVKFSDEGDDEAYYFVDDIYLWRSVEGTDCPCNNMTGTIEIKKDSFKVGQTFVLRNIFFETDKWDLLPESYAALDSLYDILEEHPTMAIEISGHTDNRASAQHNKTLSYNRAAAVRNYLANKGIDDSRLDFDGYGMTRPVASNDTEEGRQKNRRVEFRILRL